MSTSLVRSVFFSCLRQELHQARGVLTSSQMLRLMVQELSTPFFREIFSEKKNHLTDRTCGGPLAQGLSFGASFGLVLRGCEVATQKLRVGTG